MLWAGMRTLSTPTRTTTSPTRLVVPVLPVLGLQSMRAMGARPGVPVVQAQVEPLVQRQQVASWLGQVLV